jgi:NAD(P)-dependent dehydrogenase (short-subunit alcohol dehydrogenase family)
VGWTLTDGEDVVMRAETGRDDWLVEAEATRPFGRLLLPEDIAAPALYFASDESIMVTGAILDIEQGPVGARENVM